MSVRAPVNLNFGERTVAFSLLADPGSTADGNTLFYLRRNGYCEPEVAHAMAKILREGDRAVDVGANIGFFSLLMGFLVGPIGAVVAFEPSPNTVIKLRDNLRFNKLKHVSVVAQAVSDKVKDATLFMDADSGRDSMARTPGSIGRYPLTTTTLDEALSFDSCRLIKMDAEGSELDIALGSKRLFNPAATPYIISEVNEEALGFMGTSSDRFRTWMRSLGYDMFMLHDNGSLPTLFPPKTRITGDRLNANMLFSTVDAVSEVWNEVVFCA